MSSGPPRRSGHPSIRPAVSVGDRNRNAAVKPSNQSGRLLSRLVARAARLPDTAAGRQVAAFFAAFNQRSVEDMLACLAANPAYHNLGYPEPFRGKQAVRQVLSSLIAGAPVSWQLVVEEATSDARSAAVVFHLQDGSGSKVPLSSGLAFYCLDEAGCICRIVESSEQVFKVPPALVPAIGAAAPLLQALGSGPLGSLLPGGDAPAATSPRSTMPRQQPTGLGSSTAAATGQVGGPGSSSPISSSASSSSSLGSSAGASVASAPTAGTSAVATSSRSVAGTSSITPGSRSSRTSASRTTIGASSSGSSSGGGGDSVSELAGVWLKDIEASDAASYSRACDLMGLSGLQKTTATQLIEGLEVEQRGTQVAVRFLTVVPFFKVTEQYDFDKVVSMARRDLRRGTQQAAATIPGGGLEVQISWGEPNTGTIHELYRLVDGSTLECLSTVQVAAGSVTTRTVYRRSSSWQPRFSWNPLYRAMWSGSGGWQ